MFHYHPPKKQTVTLNSGWHLWGKIFILDRVETGKDTWKKSHGKPFNTVQNCKYCTPSQRARCLYRLSQQWSVIQFGISASTIVQNAEIWVTRPKVPRPILRKPFETKKKTLDAIHRFYSGNHRIHRAIGLVASFVQYSTYNSAGKGFFSERSLVIEIGVGQFRYVQSTISTI